MGSHERGFTIIEVLLFLAISGLMLAAAIMGVTANINNSRFNDGLRSTESYLQREYNEVASGVNDRDEALACDAFGQITTGGPSNPTKSPGMTNCVILGRFIKLGGSKLTSRYIIGYGATGKGDDTTAIRAMNPVVAPTIAYEGTYDVPGGIDIVNTTLPSSTSAISDLAIIKSPASGIVLYYMKAGTASSGIDNSFINLINLNKNAKICLSDGQRNGRINMLSNGRGQEVIQADLATSGAC